MYTTPMTSHSSNKTGCFRLLLLYLKSLQKIKLFIQQIPHRKQWFTSYNIFFSNKCTHLFEIFSRIFYYKIKQTSRFCINKKSKNKTILKEKFLTYFINLIPRNLNIIFRIFFIIKLKC